MCKFPILDLHCCSSLELSFSIGACIFKHQLGGPLQTDIVLGSSSRGTLKQRDDDGSMTHNKIPCHQQKPMRQRNKCPSSSPSKLVGWSLAKAFALALHV